MNNTIEKAKSSFLWSAFEKFSVQGIGFIITIIISRLVTPADYGLIAMLSIFLVVSQVIVDSGLSNYLIQNQQRTIDDYNTIFYLNIFIGIACYSILFLSAPWIAKFYNQHLLISILRVYAVAIVINSFTLVQRAKIFIDNKYKRLSFITIVSIIISGIIAIYIGYRGYGAWALVSYYCNQAAVSSILLWILSDWYPKLKFNYSCAVKAVDFGWKLLIANLINSMVSNLYTLAIGKKYNAVELGFYGRGQSIAYLYPSNISNTINQAVYPILCELQTDDGYLRSIFIKYIKIAAIISMLPLALLSALSTSIISILLGSQWLSAAPFVSILSIAYMFDPIMRLNAVALNVKGNTSYSLKAEILKKICLCVTLCVSLHYDVIVVAMGVILYSILDLIVVTHFVRRVIAVTLKDEVIAFAPILFLAFVLMALIYLTRYFLNNDYIEICLSITWFILIFVIALKITGLKIKSLYKIHA